MTLADEMIITALELITVFGSDIVLQKKSSQSYVDGKVIVVEGDSIPLSATIEAYNSDEIEGLINVGDIRIMIAFNEGVTYDIANDKVIFSNNTYNIINIEPLILQNKVVLYNLQVRK